MAQNMNAAGSVPASPSVATSIGSTGLRGRVTGVTRFGSRAGLIVAGVLALLAFAIVYGVSASGSHRSAATAAAPAPEILSTAQPLLEGIPGADATPAPATQRQGAQRPTSPKVRTQPLHVGAPVAPAGQTAPVLPEEPVQPALTRTPDVPDVRALPQPQTIAMPAPAIDPATALKLERKQQALQAAQQAAQAAQAAADSARRASIIVSGPVSGAVATAAAPVVQAAAAATPAAVAQTTSDPASTDPTTASQRAKNEFVSMQKSTTANDYLTASRQASISPYEVQAGSIIPAILITGINSDLPGQMIGQVSQNVYDSKTGQYLLIPAGSKLVGRYDSQVVNGQSRVLVAWQRIIFPDSSFIDIGGMSGTDTAGYSGLTGKVDDHSGKLFRNAILFSLIGAGTALLQPRTAVAALTAGGAAVVQAPTVASQVAGQVGTNVGQVAQQSAQQGVQQQPTIEVRPGYLFNILVDRDLVLPGPYTK